MNVLNTKIYEKEKIIKKNEKIDVEFLITEEKKNCLEEKVVESIIVHRPSPMVTRSIFSEGGNIKKVVRSRSACVEEEEEKEEDDEDCLEEDSEERSTFFTGGSIFLSEKRGGGVILGEKKDKKSIFFNEKIDNEKSILIKNIKFDNYNNFIKEKKDFFIENKKMKKNISIKNELKYNLEKEENLLNKNNEKEIFIDNDNNFKNINIDNDDEKKIIISQKNNNIEGNILNDNNITWTFLDDKKNCSGNILLSENVTGLSFLNDNKGTNFLEDNNSHKWINYTHNYSPELKRDTEVIFEEKIVNENNGDLENSDYSDQSQSPENSISSNDNSSNSSSDSSSDETVTAFEEPLPEKVHTYRITSEPCCEFQDIFKNINDDEFSGKRYHQPPKALDRDAAKRLARRLYECDGFKITDVAKHLSKRNDFSQIVGEEFANYFELTGLRLDKALRLFLSKFTLTGETQERERIMHHFSKRYVFCNYDMYNGEDACHTLVCALIILNTNIHNQNQPKMSCNDFIVNLKDFNEGENFPIDNLKELYSAIEQEPIRWPMDDELVGIVNMPKTELVDFSKQLINPPFSIGFDLPRDSNSRDFMCGYVVRKWLKEHGGKKAAFGKRGWKLFYGRLRDLTLNLYKDHDKSVTQTVNITSKRHNSVKLKKSQSDLRKQSKKLTNSINDVKEVNKEPSTTNVTEPIEGECISPANTIQNVDSKCSVVNSENSSNDVNKPCDPSTSKPMHNLVLPPADTEIHINHAYASRAVDYVKKKNVFRIKTKYGSEYLFQVNTEKEMDGWIDNINYVAALLSDPEPTIGICTMEKLSARSIPLPKITTLNVRDQLENHQKCLIELEKVIKSLKENTPKRLDKRSRLELEESIKFREDELQRYKTYCQLLEFELVRIQNIVNIRMSGPDSSSYFYQPFQKTGSTQSAHFFNQGIIVNQQMLNNAPMPSDYYINNVIVNPQQNIRFRPPPVHQNLAVMSVNRRLRSRQPAPLIQNLQSLSTSQITQSISPSSTPLQTDIPPDTVYSPPTNSTFYEIV